MNKTVLNSLVAVVCIFIAGCGPETTNIDLVNDDGKAVMGLDYRDFDFDNKKLRDYLLDFPKERYMEMTEASFEWNKHTKLGSIEELEKILQILE